MHAAVLTERATGRARLWAALCIALSLGCADHPSEPDAGPGAPCAPLEVDACEAGLRCAAVDAFPLRGRCVPPGPRPEGAPCVESALCRVGLQCIWGRCLRPCQRDAECPAQGSRCAVAAGSVEWSACTLVGACDDRLADTCGAGAVCRSTSIFGTGECLSPGPGGDGAPCSSPADCDAQHTCYLPGDHPLGACRPVCSPIGTDCAQPRRCASFIDRPIDVGACKP